ncbi:AAA family ATPase [Chloroflexota bacterium]
MNESTTDTQMAAVSEVAEKLAASVGRVIVGKAAAVELLTVALLCEGHILIEDVPGTGKTILAKALARSLGCSFKRIQCTPDLLPADVTGIHYYNQKTGEFELRPGPVMSNILLVDEINRATPRTQSCLLEAMQEQQVTVDLETVPLPRPFLVIATQNPVEMSGTFPLPEAQLDRFLIRIGLGYPDEAEEYEILERFREGNPAVSLESVVTAEDLLEMQGRCRQVRIAEPVRNYIAAITRATRQHEGLRLGASPRATLGLGHASQALAAIRGRDYVMPDDVKLLAVPALAHRVIQKTESRLKGKSAVAVISEVVASVAVPAEE